jgi:hypothetical protein
MPDICEALGTIWVPTDPQTLPPGALAPFKIDPGQQLLVIAYAASSYQPGTWWDGSCLSLYAKKCGKTSFMMSDKELPGNVLHDSASGLRYLAEPITLHTKEWLDVYVRNNSAVAAPIVAYAEAVWMGDEALKLYEADPVYRLAVKREIATLIRGR